MTLVELLAVITILSIVMIILTSILSNGLNVSEKQKSKSSLQQQANYVLVVWREFHEEGSPYKIIVSEDQTKITFNLLEDDSETIVKTQVIEYPNYLFTLYKYEKFDEDEENIEEDNDDKKLKAIPFTEAKFKPKAEKNITIKILIEDSKNGNQQPIKTTLSRL